MEKNNKRVEGRFLANVLKGALPGAIVILINSLIIIGLNNKLEMTHEVNTTLIVLTATFTMFILLFKICQPLNRFRGLIVTIMFSIFLAVVFFRPDFVSLVPFYKLNFIDAPPLNISQILLLLVLIQSTYPLLYIFENILGWMKKLLNKTISIITNI